MEIRDLLEYKDFKNLRFSIHPSLYAKDYIGYFTTLLKEDTVLRLELVEKNYYRIYGLNNTLDFMCCIYLKYNDEKVWIPRIDIQRLKQDKVCDSIELSTYGIQNNVLASDIDGCEKLLNMIAYIVNEVYPLNTSTAKFEIRNILNKFKKEYD